MRSGDSRKRPQFLYAMPVSSTATVTPLPAGRAVGDQVPPRLLGADAERPTKSHCTRRPPARHSVDARVIRLERRGQRGPRSSSCVVVVVVVVVVAVVVVVVAVAALVVVVTATLVIGPPPDGVVAAAASAWAM